jgi:hypothetical protein
VPAIRALVRSVRNLSGDSEGHDSGEAEFASPAAFGFPQQSTEIGLPPDDTC